jgi:phage tail-like protein
MADFLDQFPALTFHYSVDIDGNTISFSEVSGLDMEAEVLEYRYGTRRPPVTMKKIGMLKTSNLVCKKGIFLDDDRLVEWYNHLVDPKGKFHAQNETIDVDVHLLDETGKVVLSWNIINAVVVKLTGPTLKSDSSEVAIESIEFAHEGAYPY